MENLEKINEIEITCEVYDDLQTIKKILESKGLKYKEEFTLNDIYMKNNKTNEFGPEGGRITDTLIIRHVNENDIKIICKRRKYNIEGIEISIAKSMKKVDSIEVAEKQLNSLGYTRYLNMIDKNYMYENDEFIVFIQEVKDLGLFLEVEIKQVNQEEQNKQRLINFVKSLELNIGIKFDIRKVELLYNKKVKDNS